MMRLRNYLNKKVLSLLIGKSFQYCQAAGEDLFKEERGNDLQRDLREMMRLVEL